jgi:hypothetical protein
MALFKHLKEYLHQDHSLKPAQANSSPDPISKNPITKNWASGVTQGEGPEFKPQYHKK